MIDFAEMKYKTSAPIGKLRKLHRHAAAYLKSMNEEDRRLSLRIIERLVLGTTGHKATIKFGGDRWRSEKCSVCGVRVQEKGQGVWLISRFEKSSVMLFLCETHASDTFEVDIDILTGALKSKIGYA